jgi:hypothetical protein
MKRRNPPTPNITDKKQRLQGPRSKASYLKEVDSIHDQARPYRLVTAKFPIDSLTPVWTVGANRPIDDAHKRRLCEIFKEQGVLRKDLGYRLRVACTKAQVQKMLDHINRGRAHNADSGSVDSPGDKSEYPSFEGWDIIIGEKAELMAGNHRVEALKEYLRRSKSPENERWWICDVYDKGIV